MRAYSIISNAVESGIIGGLNKAEKYDLLDKPSENKEAIIEHLYNYIMNDLCEVMDFD